MKQKLRLKVLLFVVLIGLMFPINSFAESNPYILLDSDRGVSSVISTVNTYTKKEYGLTLLRTASGNSKKVFINKVGYLELKTKEKRDVMAHTLDSISNSSLGGRDRSRLYNFVEEQDEGTASVVRQLSSDVTTDLATASSILKPFSSPISVFLGVACIILFFMLTVSVVFDIAFLTIPVVQAFVMRKDQDRPFYISQGAWDALLIAESNLGTGNNPSVWGIYFKNQVKTFIMVGITLGYLIGGQVFDFATFIVDLFLTIFE